MGCVTVPLGQRAAVTALALTTSGAAAIGYDNGRIEVWDTTDGRLRRTLEHPPSTYQRLDPGDGPDPAGDPGESRRGHRAGPERGRRGRGVGGAPGRQCGGLGGRHRALADRLVKSADMRMTGVDEVALGGSGRYALLIGHQTRVAHLWETKPTGAGAGAEQPEPVLDGRAQR